MPLGLNVEPGYPWTTPNDPITRVKLQETATPQVTIPDGSVTAAQLDSTTNAILAEINSRNYFVNADFASVHTHIPTAPTSHWETGVGSPSNMAANGSAARELIYGPACWGINRFLTNAVLSRGTLLPGSAELPNSLNYLLWTQPAAIVGTGWFASRVENVASLAGDTCTFRFWVKPSGGFNIRLQLTQHFGSGGGATADVDSAIQSIALTANVWQQVSKTFTLPSVSGATIGTNVEGTGVSLLPHFLEARIIGPPSIGFTLQVGEMELKRGSNPPAFRRIDQTLEEQRVCRYYEVLTATVTNSITNLRPSVYFKVRKRGNATVGWDLGAGSGGTFLDPSDPGMTYQNTANSALTIATITAAAELVRNNEEQEV